MTWCGRHSVCPLAAGTFLSLPYFFISSGPLGGIGTPRARGSEADKNVSPTGRLLQSGASPLVEANPAMQSTNHNPLLQLKCAGSNRKQDAFWTLCLVWGPEV